MNEQLEEELFDLAYEPDRNVLDILCSGLEDIGFVIHFVQNKDSHINIDLKSTSSEGRISIDRVAKKYKVRMGQSSAIFYKYIDMLEWLRYYSA